MPSGQPHKRLHRIPHTSLQIPILQPQNLPGLGVIPPIHISVKIIRHIPRQPPLSIRTHLPYNIRNPLIRKEPANREKPPPTVLDNLDGAHMRLRHVPHISEDIHGPGGRYPLRNFPKSMSRIRWLEVFSSSRLARWGRCRPRDKWRVEHDEVEGCSLVADKIPCSSFGVDLHPPSVIASGKEPTTGDWELVQPIDGLYVVYVGQELQKLSQGRHNAALHWVKQPKDSAALVVYLLHSGGKE
ncbi:hypothetical protein GB937_002965 [Aspergillus fischeri]|nr:hypothetical protein GB937_002965 [Aspergillus fischeri]